MHDMRIFIWQRRVNIHFETSRVNGWGFDMKTIDFSAPKCQQNAEFPLAGLILTALRRHQRFSMEFIATPQTIAVFT